MKLRPLDTPVVTGKTNAPVETKNSPAPTGSTQPPVTSTFGGASRSSSNELDGTRRGYVSPTQVESPFSPDERAVLQKKIPCPALAGLFTSGLLKVEKDGTVQIPDLERALSQVGPSEGLKKILTRGADKTDTVAGSFNVFKLNGSNLDHTGSTGIRQDGVHPERFDVLTSHSKDGKTLTAKDLADAAEQFAREDPGLRGRVTQLGEMSLVLNVFGQYAEDGTRFLSFQDAKQLFVDGQIPSSWSPPAVPGNVSVVDVLGGAALGLFRQFVNGK